MSDLQVGEWHVYRASNEMRSGSETVRLEPKAMEVLVLLAERAGQVVTREDLLSKVWPGVIVGDDAISQTINKIRRTLRDDAHHPKYVETIAKRGYRLIAPVTHVGTAAKPPVRRRGSTIGTVIALGFAAIGIALWLASRNSNVDVSAPPIVAVLPFVNASGDPKRDYFSDGVTADIINSLGRFSAMRVISRPSVHNLGARYVLTGSVRESENKVRVAVELSDAEKGTLLWSERYDGAGRDLFTMQEDVVSHIAAALDVKVTRLELARAVAKPPSSLEAYDAVLRARGLIETSDRAANRQARELLAAAAKTAPDYAELWVVASNAEILRANLGWTETPAESLRIAEEHARRALALDDSGAHSRAHGLLGVIYSAQGRFDDSLDEADRAIALNPSDSFAYDTRGQTLLWLGRFDEALASLDTASRYNPAIRNVSSGFNRALAHFMLGQYRQAVAAADETLARNPQVSFLHVIRAAALAEMGRTEEAKAAAETVHRLDPFFDAAPFGTRFVNAAHYERLQAGLKRAGL